MQKPEFLPRIRNVGLPIAERLVLLAQFVLLNGLDGPMDLIPPRSLPKGFVFRTRLFADLVVCLAIPQGEARDNPSSALADSAQMWQLWLDEEKGVVPRQSGVLCTLNGPITRVVEVDDALRVDRVLTEWAQDPPLPPGFLSVMQDVAAPPT